MGNACVYRCLNSKNLARIEFERNSAKYWTKYGMLYQISNIKISMPLLKKRTGGIKCSYIKKVIGMRLTFRRAGSELETQVKNVSTNPRVNEQCAGWTDH